MTVVTRTQMPRPGGRLTQGSIGVRECNERVAQATCTGLGTLSTSQHELEGPIMMVPLWDQFG